MVGSSRLFAGLAWIDKPASKEARVRKYTVLDHTSRLALLLYIHIYTYTLFLPASTFICYVCIYV